MPHLQGEEFVRDLEKVEQLREIANAKQVEVAHIVLAWYLTLDDSSVKAENEIAKKQMIVFR